MGFHACIVYAGGSEGRGYVVQLSFVFAGNSDVVEANVEGGKRRISRMRGRG